MFPRTFDVLATVKSGSVDVVFSNLTPARARDMDFSPVFKDVDMGFLVVSGASVTTLADMKRGGLRIGVSEGSTSEAELQPGYAAASMHRSCARRH